MLATLMMEVAAHHHQKAEVLDCHAMSCLVLLCLDGVYSCCHVHLLLVSAAGLLQILNDSVFS